MIRGSRPAIGLVVALLCVVGWWLATRSGPTGEPVDAGVERGRQAEPEAPTLRGADLPPTPVPTPAVPATRVDASESEDRPGKRFTVRGRVSDRTTGRALVDADVRGGAVDDPRALRFPFRGLKQTRTDEDGRYELVFELEIPPRLLAIPPLDLAFTVLARGYQSPHARPKEADGEVYMETSRLTVVEGGEAELDFTLLPGLDIGGVVVDDEGTPIEGVSIVVSEQDASSTAYREVLSTDRQGRWRVHDLPPREYVRDRDVRGVIAFTEPVHVATTIEDAYALSDAELASLEVIMARGFVLRGTLHLADGSPAVHHLVESFRGDANANRKCAYTNVDGTFAITGLEAGEVVLRASSAQELSFVERAWDVQRNDEAVTLHLQPLPFARTAERHRALGLEFVVMPPEIKALLGYPDAYALWITEVGEDAPKALRHWAEPGDVLWSVGRTTLASVRNVAEGVLRSVDRYASYDEQAGRPPREEYGVGIVLGIRRPDLAGTNTQGMKVTREEVEALRRWLAEHPADD